MIKDNKSLTFALFGNTFQEKKSMAVQKFLAIAEQHNANIIIQKSFYQFLKDRIQISLPKCEVADNDDFEADYVVCMGGDGTFLDVAGRVGKKKIPIIGFNTGRLGFLASFLPEDIEEVFEDIAVGKVNVEERAVLMAQSDEIELGDMPFALNEVAVLKHDISSMIGIHTSINGEYLTTYQADGLIIGTPTGSTAYSLSVGGPIMVPKGNDLLLTPVAPHSLNMRPIVIDDNSEVELKVQSRSGSFLVAIDGRSCSYPDYIHLHIKKADFKVKVVVKKNHSFFATLRQKMMWGIDNRF